MSSDELPFDELPLDALPFDALFAEGRRQLDICNSCRYCAGYCPVWPELETVTELTPGDLTHLSNLCHDCNDCFTACMYTAPHEFALNPPKLFAEVRERTYATYLPRPAPGQWLARLLGRPRLGRPWPGVAAVVLSALVLIIAWAATHGPAGPAGSPYRVISYAALVALFLIPVGWAVAVTAVAVMRYWKDVGGPARRLLHPVVWLQSLHDGLLLRHMSGGRDRVGCTNPTETPGMSRRYLHLALLGGLALCLAATVSAAVLQDFLGEPPPYPILSVPALAGVTGGAGMIVGAGGMLLLKRRHDPALTTRAMARSDRALGWALLVLAASGLLARLVQGTPAFGPVLIVHLTAVLAAFVIAPYTKFMHFVYRMLSIYRDRLGTRWPSAADKGDRR